MFELLFLCGLLGLALGSIWEFLSSLPAFPTLLTAAAAVPLLAWADYLRLVQRLDLGGLSRHRRPVPPERFYWPRTRSRIRWTLSGCGLLALASWYAALAYPAGFDPSLRSAGGWIAAGAAILSTARLFASAVLYVRASQWFDKMSPWIVGVCRRSLYRLSENPDFLAPGDPARQEEEKSIY